MKSLPVRQELFANLVKVQASILYRQVRNDHRNGASIIASNICRIAGI